jgi:DNA-binding NarL/FixJ family response regulator
MHHQRATQGRRQCGIHCAPRADREIQGRPGDPFIGYRRTQPFDILCKSVHRIREGQIWASNEQIRYLIDALAAPPPPITNAKGAPLLTKREQTLVQLVTEGRSNKDISRELNLSEHTVRNYLFRIFNKLGTSSRLELALYAINQRQAPREPVPAESTDAPS